MEEITNAEEELAEKMTNCGGAPEGKEVWRNHMHLPLEVAECGISLTPEDRHRRYRSGSSRSKKNGRPPGPLPRVIVAASGKRTRMERMQGRWDISGFFPEVAWTAYECDLSKRLRREWTIPMCSCSPETSAESRIADPSAVFHIVHWFSPRALCPHIPDRPIVSPSIWALS